MLRCPNKWQLPETHIKEPFLLHRLLIGTIFITFTAMGAPNGTSELLFILEKNDKKSGSSLQQARSNNPVGIAAMALVWQGWGLAAAARECQNHSTQASAYLQSTANCPSLCIHRCK